MKKQLSLPLAVLFAAAILFSAFALTAQQAYAQSSGKDTVPVKAKDFDVILKDLDKSMIELEKQMQSKTLLPTIDLEKMKIELDKSLQHMDLEKMKVDLEKMKIELKEMPPIDLEKMKVEMGEFKNIDMTKMQKEIELAMKGFDTAKMHMELKAFAAVDMEKLRAELEEIKNIDLTKVQMELKDLKPALENAKHEIARAKDEITEYKNFTDELHKDGLINKESKYSIEHKDGSLIINDKVQSKDIYNKYSNFLQKHKKFTIKKQDDGLNIFLD